MIKTISYKNFKLSTDLIVLGIFEGEKTLSAIKSFNKDLRDLASEILEKENFKGK